MTDRVCTIHIDDEINARVAGLTPNHFDSLFEKMGVMTEGARFKPAVTFGAWDGKNRYFKKNGQTFTRLLDEILPYIDEWGYEFNLIEHRPPVPTVDVKPEFDFLLPGRFELRPYQLETVNAMLAEGSGFAECCTGSGKTLIAAVVSIVLASHDLPVIVIVPSSDLVEQTRDTFVEAIINFPHLSIGVYSGSSKDLNHPIVIGTWQAIQHQPELILRFKAMIVDEAHQIKANVLTKLVSQFGKNIAFRFGMTGTMPKPLEDQYNLKSCIGRVVARVDARTLIDLGYLAELSIQPVVTQDPDLGLPDYASEKKYLSTLDTRNLGIAGKIMDWRDTHGNTMVLVNSLEQGRTLEEMIPGSIFISGVSKKDHRRVQYESYETMDDLIVIATYGIMSTGISIDRIFSLVMIDAGKSFIRAIQTIGRGLRKNRDKTFVYVYDIHSRLTWGVKHFKDRKRFYKEASYPVLTSIKLDYE